jgi:type II secretory pathway pseudopilin PulG
MSGSKTRADELVDAWLSATARPVPAFVPRGSHRGHPPRTAVIVLAAILIVAAFGAILIGGYLRPTQDQRQAQDAQSPAELAASAARALATAPGVRYALTIAVHFRDGSLHLDSSGEIDFERHRFSGIADGGGGPMLYFGGPSSGAVVVADGLYVRTGAGSWAHIADPSSPLDRLIDRDGVSGAVARWIASSQIDPTIHGGLCAAQRCQVVRLAVPPVALSELQSFMFGQGAWSPLPTDLAPISVDLYIDSSGFPVQMETAVTAGDTTTAVSLQLSRVDPAPTITQPIP